MAMNVRSVGGEPGGCAIAVRTWDDLPWAAHRVTLAYQQRRICCRTCGIRTERVAFADPKARITRRLRQLIGLDCQSMPTSHAAARHGVSWSKARRRLFAANRRLFKAYVLREQLDRLWTYKKHEGVARFLFGWLKALRWQRLPEMKKLGDTLVNRFDGIAAYCDYPLRFGVVESLNTTIKGVLRRPRGMRDDSMLLLKLKWATARPIRSSRDLVQFLQPIRANS